MRVAWFSAGVSSAVAIKIDNQNIDEVIYIDIDDQHLDTMRFVKDCERWFGRNITILKSERFNDVESACLVSGYVNSPFGAPCTVKLKKDVRKLWEKKNKCCEYVWGMDLDEQDRATRIIDSMTGYSHVFPLIEKRITKEAAHQMLKLSGIKRPIMYDLGYPNNNCIGCLKGGKGYWNKIRKDFPEVFKRRAEMERKIRGSCLKDFYLDELPRLQGKDLVPVVEDCGLFCLFEGLK